ncbi:MAG: type I phosphomannose isomerase catalytic subunit [Sarcina sp.]
MYPMKFENLYFEKVWGGRGFEEFRNNLPKDKIGESWDVSCHENGKSIISNGEFKGETLESVINVYGAKVIGDNIKTEFPLLIKLINSSEKLSVQVHPDDRYAKKVEDSNGKTEFWYVVDAKKGANLVIGTKDCDKTKFTKAIEMDATEEYLNIVDVEKGDCFLIKSGLVHAIGDGVIIAEIQQSSDITYRIYDYHRGRKLHTEKALDVIDFSLESKNLNNRNKREVFIGDIEKNKIIMLCDSKYFTVEKYLLSSVISEKSDRRRFYIFICIEGRVKIDAKGKVEYIEKGESVFIPASLGEYKLVGQAILLKVFV